MRDGRGYHLAVGAMAGILGFFLILLTLDLASLPWGFASLALAVVAGMVGLILSWRRTAGSAPSVRSWGWGDAVAVLCLALFAVCTAALWDLHPDFIYLWGIKGKTFALARGIDWDYLARPWHVHHLGPDYPNLLPSLFAVTALLGGGFREVPMALWSVVWFALLLLCARELLERLGVSRFAGQTAMAVLGLTLTMFGVGYLSAGGADWLIALALTAAAVPLVSRPGPAADWQLGIAAALAAASKIEGVPLAVFLIGAHLVRRRDAIGAVALRAGLPALAVTAPWAFQAWRHDLFQATEGRSLDLERLPLVLTEMARSLLTVNWHFWSLCLLLLPLLIAWRRTRVVATVCALQLGFYVYVYLSASTDPALYIRTSAARLYFQLVPVVLLLMAAWIDRENPRLSPA